MKPATKRCLPDIFVHPKSKSSSRATNEGIVEYSSILRKYAALVVGMVLVFLTASAFAQRGGGSGAGGGGSHSGGGSRSGAEGHSDESVPATVHASSTAKSSGPESMKTGSTVQPAADPIGQPETSPSRSQAESAYFESRDAETAAPNPRPVNTYPREVTIGFPPRPSDDRLSFARPPYAGTIVEGQRDQLWAEIPQRGAAPQHGTAPRQGAPVRSPASGARPVTPAPGPVGGVRFARPMRVASRPFASRPFWFLEQPRLADGPPHVFSPRRRPSGFGGFGFFGFPFGGFGFGAPFFGFGFFGDCNPFWAWPWAFGCNAYGYWSGYTAGFYTGYDEGFYQPEVQEETEQPSEELETNTFIPPPEPSSSAEIQAEKVLVVLYMKNGAVYAVTNYWIADGRLHYKTSYGGENTIDMNDLDLQKTVDVNARRGITFTLKPAPDQNPPNQPQPPHDQPNSPGSQE
jgi:hypothetical protein